MNELIAELEELLKRIGLAELMLDVPKIDARIAVIEMEMQSPDFWTDQKNAQEKGQELDGLKTQRTTIENLKKNVTDLLEMARMDDADTSVDMREDIEKQYRIILKQFEAFEITLLLSDEYDQRNAIL